MKLSEDLEQKLFNISRKEKFVYRFVQTVAYGSKTNDKSIGYTDVPTKQEVLNELEVLVDKISEMMKSDTYEPPKNVFNTENDSGKILLMREELVKQISLELKHMLGAAGLFGDAAQEITRELKNIKIQEDKSFLKNVYHNIVSKNTLMKLMAGSCFLNNSVNETDISKLKFETITDTVPRSIMSYYCSEQFRETRDVKYLDMLNKDEEDLEILVDEELTEANIRDFIEMMIESVRVINSMYIKSMTVSMIFQGRKITRG